MDLDYNIAMSLLEKHVGDKKGIILHAIAVSNFLVEVCNRLINNNPDIKIDIERIRTVGLLHDIGKIREKKELGGHAFIGARILEKEGFPEIGKIIETHGISKETAESDGISGNFEPETIEEKLLTYADAHVRHDKVVSFEERVSDVLERNKANPRNYKNLQLGLERVGKIVREIDSMLK
ncbi:HD domain-containing protein [Candidatus Pacearchaeota archaeon]|nr:HD domain-containing protein [Candidatus Pacearchaeota archaeon]